jgi:hypothetical protein
MGIVSAGAGLGKCSQQIVCVFVIFKDAGCVVHPIMLNYLFHGSVGYHNGVRISAGLTAGLLVIAVLMMRTRLLPKNKGSKFPITEFLKDPHTCLSF